MATDDGGLLELHKQHQARQEKYAYFLLAVAASAVAFAIQKTSGMKLTWWLLPVGGAALSWGASFYCGCRNLHWVQAALGANYNLVSLLRGTHSDQPRTPELLTAAQRGVRSALKSNVEQAQFHALWQFRFLIIGALLFVAWHLGEMYRLTFVS
jgi:hypothetical protein